MIKLIITISIVLNSLTGFAQRTSEISVIQPEVYQKQVAEGDVQLVDVRTPKEFEQGHIKGAENIDFKSDGFLKQFQKFDKEKPLYIYCRSGNRSGKAARELSEMGFKSIINLKGGFLSWEGAVIK